LAVSDTHGSNKIIEDAIKGMKGDIFIHAGDFTRKGK
jgi:predicted phosphodiesterase